MTGSLAVAAYVDAQRDGQLDWAVFIQAVADKCHARSALALHHFGIKTLLIAPTQGGASVAVATIANATGTDLTALLTHALT